ncbi:peptidylprolyl isomerase [Paenibacillus sp. BR2-3]|uniref:peptidylprolyl isomerase n=1 Tax=Paenibacillus sp. BR2-3 TaxID=3048494 RepID=UPI003977D8D9
MFMCLLLVIAAGCGNKPGNSNSTAAATEGVPSAAASHPVVTIEMDNGGMIKAELYPEVAPNTVNNFISLIKKGFYDGAIFHRVIPGFMIQGGDPEGTGGGGPGYSIAGEFTGNGFVNNLLHSEGILSMARSQEADSAGSQFFIMTAAAPHLDGSYAAFGKVTEGLEVVSAIVNLPRDDADRPENPPAMKKVTVDTLGVTYPEPQKVQ